METEAKTNFFTELVKQLGSHDATLTISQAEGKLTVSFLPQKKDGKSDLIPLNMTGSVEEFDTDFIPEIAKAMVKVERKGLVTNQEEFDRAAQESGEEAPENTGKSKRSSAEKNSSQAIKEKVEKYLSEGNLKGARQIRDRANKAGGLPKEKIAELDQLIADAKDNKPKAVQLEVEKEAAKAEAQTPAASEPVVEVVPVPEPPAPVVHPEEDLTEFKTLLQKKLTDDKEEFAFIKRAKEKGSNTFTPDQVAVMYENQVALIEQVEKALERVDNKTYGVCINTGKLITKERLLKDLLTQVSE